jgi:hypothetical protein
VGQKWQNLRLIAFYARGSGFLETLPGSGIGETLES